MEREQIPNLVLGSEDAESVGEEGALRFSYLRENPELCIDIVRAGSHSPSSRIGTEALKGAVMVGHDVSDFVSSSVKQALESRIVQQYPVCVTGEMGAGKSTFSKEIANSARKWGIPCTYVDFDSLAHEIYFSLTDPVYEKTRRKVAEAFGPQVVSDNGFIDRTKLAAEIGKNPDGIDLLNDILRKPMLLRYGDIVAGKSGLVLVDGALLAEFSLTHLGNHHAVIVSAPEEERVGRVVKRYAKGGRTMSETDVRKMFALQMNGDAKEAEIRKKIAESNNGSILRVDNGRTLPSSEKALFEILSNVDVFGEIRAGMVLRALGLTEIDASALVAELKRKHEEPHRHYHTWEHVVELLDHLFDAAVELGLSDDEIGLLGTAALTHDAVYEVDSTNYRNNEIRSSEYAKRALESRNVTPAKIGAVCRMVRETAHSSRSEPTDRLSALLHDLDLAVLAAEPARYALYVADIVTEFGIYPGREFAAKRLEILRSWLADDSLYVSEYGKSRFLERARKNVAEEIAKIES